MSELNGRPDVTGFFDPQTHTIAYVVADPETGACAIFDAVMDIDYAACLLYTSPSPRD